MKKNEKNEKNENENENETNLKKYIQKYECIKIYFYYLYFL